MRSTVYMVTFILYYRCMLSLFLSFCFICYVVPFTPYFRYTCMSSSFRSCLIPWYFVQVYAVPIFLFDGFMSFPIYIWISWFSVYFRSYRCTRLGTGL